MDLTGPINQLGNFDIVILANIIHETLPVDQKLRPCDSEGLVKQSLNKVSGLLSKGGKLVILDGLKPDFEEQPLIINFKNLESKNLFIEFSQKYKAFMVQTEMYGNGVITRTKDVAAFSTKARYLHERYWDIEATQNYQYFSEKQFRKVIGECGMIVERLEPQRFAPEFVNNIIESVYPAIEFPAKKCSYCSREELITPKQPDCVSSRISGLNYPLKCQ